jgi:hypothetical protein
MVLAIPAAGQAGYVHAIGTAPIRAITDIPQRALERAALARVERLVERQPGLKVALTTLDQLRAVERHVVEPQPGRGKGSRIAASSFSEQARCDVQIGVAARERLRPVNCGRELSRQLIPSFTERFDLRVASDPAQAQPTGLAGETGGQKVGDMRRWGSICRIHGCHDQPPVGHAARVAARP